MANFVTRYLFFIKSTSLVRTSIASDLCRSMFQNTLHTVVDTNPPIFCRTLFIKPISFESFHVPINPSNYAGGSAQGALENAFEVPNHPAIWFRWIPGYVHQNHQTCFLVALVDLSRVEAKAHSNLLDVLPHHKILYLERKKLIIKLILHDWARKRCTGRGR